MVTAFSEALIVGALLVPGIETERLGSLATVDSTDNVLDTTANDDGTPSVVSGSNCERELDCAPEVSDDAVVFVGDCVCTGERCDDGASLDEKVFAVEDVRRETISEVGILDVMSDETLILVKDMLREEEGSDEDTVVDAGSKEV